MTKAKETKDLLAVEVKEVIYDKKEQMVYIYLEDNDTRSDYIERFRQRDLSGNYFICISYDLTNPNKVVDLGLKLRKILTNKGITGSEIFKEYTTWESWISSLKGMKVNLNSYGQLS